MHPDAFHKLCAASPLKLPHMQPTLAKSLCRLVDSLFVKDELRYWGVSADTLQYRGHSMLHCYNFGNVRTTCPWHGTLQNFGYNLHLEIIQCGTVRRKREDRALLDQIRQPYLALEYKSAPFAAEYLQPGMLLIQEGAPPQRTEFDVVFPEASDPPSGPGVLFYFLVRRIPFTTEHLCRWLPSGATAGLRCIHITLQQPVIMEPGWPVLLLEKDCWSWGVVSAA